MTSWLKAQTRRLEQNLLEGLGAVASSRDESYDRDNARLKRLEDEIHVLNAAVLSLVVSERKALEDRLNLYKTLEVLSASDLKSGILTHNANTAVELDALRGLRARHERVTEVVAQPALKLIESRIIGPIGHLIRFLPTLRKLIDARRESCSDYDAYQRRLRAEQQAHLNIGGAIDPAAAEALAKAKAKSDAAATALHNATEAVARALSNAERTRTALAREAAQAALATSVHTHSCSRDALGPLLVQFPGSASNLTELAGHARVVSVAAATPNSAPERRVDGEAKRGCHVAKGAALNPLCQCSFRIPPWGSPVDAWGWPAPGAELCGRHRTE